MDIRNANYPQKFYITLNYQNYQPWVIHSFCVDGNSLIGYEYQFWDY